MPPRDRRIRLHVQNDPLSPNDAVTPAALRRGAAGQCRRFAGGSR